MLRLHRNFSSQRSWFSPLSSWNIALLIAVIGLANFGASAFAGTCGHYLYRNGKPVHSQEMSADQTAAELIAEPSENQRLRETPVLPQPCRGPGCRSGSIPLAPVPAPLSIVSPTELAVLFEALTAANCAGRVGNLPVSERLPGSCVDEIFRPPANV